VSTEHRARRSRDKEERSLLGWDTKQKEKEEGYNLAKKTDGGTRVGSRRAVAISTFQSGPQGGLLEERPLDEAGPWRNP